MECKGKHQAYVSLQLKFDELEASFGHKAAAERVDAAREIEQLRLKLESLSSEKVKLQNALTVSLEDCQRLNQQLTEIRKALKDSESRIKTLECRTELFSREKANLEDLLCRKENIEQELGNALKKQTLLSETKEEDLVRTNAMLSASLSILKSEVDSFSDVLNQSREELAVKMESLEIGLKVQKDYIDFLSNTVQETEARLQERERVLQEQFRSKVKEIEEGHARKIDKLYQISLREQKDSKDVFEKQQAVLTERIKSLELSIDELQKNFDTEKLQREALIKEYDDAIDELERNHQNVINYNPFEFCPCGLLQIMKINFFPYRS